MLEKVKATFKEKPSPQKSNLHRELEKVLPNQDLEEESFFKRGNCTNRKMPIYNDNKSNEESQTDE